jgi:hypothetical protein
MKNFEFRGKRIEGGTLAGTIILGSRITNEIRDVTFAVDTTLSGKVGKEFARTKLAGRITGDANSPAKLENVTIVAGTSLDNVILGEGVVLEEGVIIGKNVTLADGKPVTPTEGTDSSPGETPTDTTPPTDSTPACEFNALGLDKNGKEVKDLKACFAIQTGKEHAEISMQVDSAHVGQKANMLLVIKVSATEWYTLDKTGGWKAWDGELANLKTKDAFEKLPETIALELANAEFSELGSGLTLFVGYQLQDGTIVYNAGESL